MTPSDSTTPEQVEFEEWWASEATGDISTSHKFAAWNGWLAAWNRRLQRPQSEQIAQTIEECAKYAQEMGASVYVVDRIRALKDAPRTETADFFANRAVPADHPEALRRAAAPAGTPLTPGFIEAWMLDDLRPEHERDIGVLALRYLESSRPDAVLVPVDVAKLFKQATGYEIEEYKQMLAELRGQHWYDCSEHGRVASTIKGHCSECESDDISMPYSGSIERKT